MVSTEERGSSMLLGILMTALLAVAVALVLGDLNHRQGEFRREARVIELTHLGDAAFAGTLAALSREPEFGGLSLRELGGGVIWSSVTPAAAGDLQVTAEAELDGWRGTIDAVVRVDHDGPFVVGWERRTRPVS